MTVWIVVAVGAIGSAIYVLWKIDQKERPVPEPLEAIPVGMKIPLREPVTVLAYTIQELNILKIQELVDDVGWPAIIEEAQRQGVWEDK